MRLGQIITIAGAVILLFGAFFLGERTTSIENRPLPQTPNRAEADFSFKDYIDKALQKLPESKQQEIATLQGNLETANSDVETIDAYNDLINIWLTFGKPAISGYFCKLLAQEFNEEKNWSKAGKLFLEGFNNQEIPVAFSAEQAIECFEKAREFNSDSLDYRLNLAIAYIDGKNEVMQGVMLLREIVEEDSTNIEANLMLGRLSIISAQYDKAISRLNTVIKADETNSKAWLLLSQAYIAQGDKENAIFALEKCKSLVNNADLIRELEVQIENIKNS